jgi:hypothetical protein
VLRCYVTGAVMLLRVTALVIPCILALSLGCSSEAGDANVEPIEATEEDVTVRAANRDFLTQWGPTAYNAAGHPDGFADCGPTSLLMAGAYLGLVAHPPPARAEASIRWMRGLTRGEPTPVSSGTHVVMMLQGIEAIGAKGTRLWKDFDAVMASLRRGNTVLIAGDPREAWGLSLDARGEYLHHYRAADGFGHWVVAFGFAPDGRVIIGDPLSTIGTIKVAPARIKQYLLDGGRSSAAIEVTP